MIYMGATSVPIGASKCYFPAFLEKYDRPNDQPINRRARVHKEVSLHVINRGSDTSMESKSWHYESPTDRPTNQPADGRTTREALLLMPYIIVN